MTNAVVFAGRNGLDFYDLRIHVVRIPEVSLRLREAQQILDLLGGPAIDLLNSVLSDDDHFFRNIKLKSLLAAIAQVGLFDRYLKTQKLPDFMVGISNGDSAALVCAGQLTFRDMIETWQKSQVSEVINLAERAASRGVEPAPLLSGISLSEFRAFQAEAQEGGLTIYRPVREVTMDLKKLLATLALKDGASRFINIGPAPALRVIDDKSLGVSAIEAVDSIELDPQLDWFWRSVRLPHLTIAVAQ